MRKAKTLLMLPEFRGSMMYLPKIKSRRLSGIMRRN
jgi:hypothetical protein